MKIFRLFTALAIAIVLSSCASGPRMSEIKSSIPTVKADQGRIYFYRSGLLGGAIQPNVWLNGHVVGESKPNGFFFLDMPPGPMEVSTSSEVEKKLTFVLEAGQTRYVRLSVGLGILVYRIYPELSNATEAIQELQDLKYTGTALAPR